jgi:hypothetical protein
VKVAEIPGYARIMARVDRLENYWRDFAFLGINEELRLGKMRVEIRLLTLRMFVQLMAVRSPFVVGGRVRAEDLLVLLWRLSPKYDSSDKAARAAFVESIAPIFVAEVFPRAVRTVSRFFDRMLLDKPPVSEGEGVSSKPDASFAAGVIHLIASKYGWRQDDILDTPMPVLFQFIRKLQREMDPEMEHFNPLTDRFTARVVQRYFARKHAQH